MHNINRNTESVSMGGCIGKLANPPPKDIVEFTGKEIREIINSTLHPADIHINDRNYGCYSRDEAERFLSHDSIDKLKYKKDSFDCDNFALAVAGRESEWYATAGNETGSSFGIVHGDIRKEESDTEPRPHAINFFIDNDGELFLVEPQSDTIFKPTSNSTFWFTLC